MTRRDRSEVLCKFFDGDTGLTEDALQSLRQKRPMIGDGDMESALGQPDVRAVLSSDSEPEAAEGFDGFAARNIARQFHAAATTGSWRKCRRIAWGALPLPK